MRGAGTLFGIVGVVGALAAGAAGAAPRLDYRGTIVSARQAGALFEPALRAPRDSSALAGALAALAGRLEDLGYLGARVVAHWDSTAGPTLVVQAREGRRSALVDWRLGAASPADSAVWAGAFHAPAWGSPADLGAAVTSAVERVSSDGYPYAVLGVSGWDVDSAGAHARLSGALGPRVTVTRVRVDGLRVTRPDLAARAIGRLSGQPYRRTSAEAARDRLDQLGLFRSVRLEGLEGEGDWSRAQLVYRVEEPRYNSFEGVVGVQGQTGTVGLAHLELGNVLGTGRSVGLRWEARGRGVVNFSARAAEPLVFGTPLRLEGAIEQLVQDSTFTRTQWGGRAVFALGAGERVEAGYEEQSVVQEAGQVEHAALQNTVFALERSTLDDPLGARRGTRARVSATQAFKTETLRPPGKRTARASAVEVNGEWDHPARGSAALSLGVQSAGRFSSQRVLPVFERYPLGGTTSLRGFDEDAFRVDRYVLTRFEYRWFFGPHAQRTFLFWDHAWTATRLADSLGTTDHLENREHDGIGFGLRLETAGGLVGIDYGLEPGRPPLEGKIHLQLVSTF